MKIILIIFLFALNFNSFAADECEGPEGSSYVEGCRLKQSIGEMDKKLNVQYQKIIKMYKKDNATETVKLLVEAQRAWIQYRDKVCEFENVAYGGANSISWGRCKARITESRLNELEEIEPDEE